MNSSNFINVLGEPLFGASVGIGASTGHYVEKVKKDTQKNKQTEKRK